MSKLYKILIAPLDWGMGHAARCVPLIKYLQKKGVQVVIAGNLDQKKYFLGEIDNEHYDYEFIELQGYNIEYGKTSYSTLLKLIGQIPKIIRNIYRESRWLKKAIQQYKIDAVISDNRYGLFTSKIPCVFMTHQLHIQAPLGSNIINSINHYFIRKFNECWVPDFEEKPSLAGNLSRLVVGLPMKYLGALSRFETAQLPFEKNGKCLLIMSGVEPQKSILKDIIIHECNKNNIPLTIVGNNKKYSSENLEVLDTCNTGKLEQLFQSHQYIISRTGYTTIMDLYALGRSALLVPTPGQTEQLYLGEWHDQKKFVIQQQDAIDLPKALLLLNKKDTFIKNDEEKMEDVVDLFLANLNR